MLAAAVGGFVSAIIVNNEKMISTAVVMENDLRMAEVIALVTSIGNGITFLIFMQQEKACQCCLWWYNALHNTF